MSPAELDRVLARARPVVSPDFADAVLRRIETPSRVACAVEPERRTRRSRVAVAAALAALAAILVLVVVVGGSPRRGGPSGKPAAPAKPSHRAAGVLENPHADVRYNDRCSACHEVTSAMPSTRRVVGPPRGVEIEAFVDLECPTCGEALRTLQILAINHGDLRIVIRHPIDQIATRAVLAAADQDRYWAMTDKLVGKPAPTRATVDALATDLRLDLDRFTRSFTDKVHPAIEVDRREAHRLRITPPAFLVDGVLFRGPHAIPLMRQHVEHTLNP
ncbi:MAG TPA: thioredoxin domain-containing protein [Kofleriaceae bacterium]